MNEIKLILKAWKIENLKSVNDLYYTRPGVECYLCKPKMVNCESDVLKWM